MLNQCSHTLTRNFLVLASFSFYLLSVPYFVSLFVPCLRKIPAASYADLECNVKIALDMYINLGLMGFVISVLSLLFIRVKRSLIPLLIAATMMAGLFIVMFNSFIPQAEKAVRNAPIILDYKIGDGPLKEP